MTSSSVPIHIFAQKHQQFQTFDCRHVILRSSTPSYATLRGTQFLHLIKRPYLCLCTRMSIITYGCLCVTQRKSLLKRESVLLKPVHPLKHAFSVITERWVLATRFRPCAHLDAGGRRAGQNRAGRSSTGNTA